MSAPADPRFTDLAFDLALSLVLAGVAFWAGSEWFRELHRDALDDLAADFEGVVDRAVTANLAARDDTAKPSPVRVETETVAGPGLPVRVERTTRAKVPRQNEPTE